MNDGEITPCIRNTRRVLIFFNLGIPGMRQEAVDQKTHLACSPDFRRFYFLHVR